MTAGNLSVLLFRLKRVLDIQQSESQLCMTDALIFPDFTDKELIGIASN